MGEARRKRLALIKGGKAEEAKKPERNPVPQMLVQRTILMKKGLADLIDKSYDEDVNQAVVTSRNAWIERLIVAGLSSFDAEKRKQAEQASLVKLAGPQDVAKAATQIAGEGRVTLR